MSTGALPAPSPLPAPGRQPDWAELWWVDLDHITPGAGRRPVLVLNRPESVHRLPRLLVAPASTQVRNLGSEVHLDAHDGLPAACVIQLDTPELIERHRLSEYISTLSATRWHEVQAAMAFAINA